LLFSKRYTVASFAATKRHEKAIHYPKHYLVKTPKFISGISQPYALITGGSKGIGYGIAEALARRSYNLILVARHQDRLLIAKNNLESTYNIHVEILINDLSRDESIDEITQWCISKDISLKLLCNDVGIGGADDYLSASLDTIRYMVRLNVEPCMALTFRLLPLLEKNTPSYILNVASMAGFAPIPVKNLYAATKSAIIFFSYSLRYQLKDKNISVSCLAPGPVYTKPEIVKETKKQLGWLADKIAITPKRAGEIAVRKTLRKKMIIVPGTLAKLISMLLRVVPRRTITAIYGGLKKD
jgi:short-subunit dehydrogenase